MISFEPLQYEYTILLSLVSYNSDPNKLHGAQTMHALEHIIKAKLYLTNL